MPVLSGAAIAGIAGAGLSFLGQNNANQTNETIANSANATSIELADTAYQRRVKDLGAAGLNPMLAYTQGGAGVPNIVTSQHSSNLGPAVSAGMNAYLETKLNASQIDTQKTQQVLNTALASKAAADADNSMASAAEARARTGVYAPQIRQTLASIDKIGAETKLSQQNLVLAKQQAIMNILQGKEIDARTGNFEMDTVLKKVNRDIAVNHLRMSDVSAAAAESPLGRYVMPFLPFGNTTAGAVAAGKEYNFSKK